MDEGSAVVFSVALYAFALVKDAILRREFSPGVHAIFGPGLVALMVVTGCPLFCVVYVPYVFQVIGDWNRRYPYK